MTKGWACLIKITLYSIATENKRLGDNTGNQPYILLPLYEGKFPASPTSREIHNSQTCQSFSKSELIMDVTMKNMYRSSKGDRKQDTKD